MYASWLRCAKWLRSVPLRQVTMAVHTVTLEAHDIDSRSGLWCDACASWSATAVDVAVAVGESLEMIGRYTATVCESCGAETFHR